jgi:hypothetical protein
MDELLKLMLTNLPNFAGLVFAIWYLSRQNAQRDAEATRERERFYQDAKDERERFYALLNRVLDDCLDDDTKPTR